MSCHNDPDSDSDCEDHISENDQTGDISSSGSSDENTEPKTELSMRTSEDGQIEPVEEVRVINQSGLQRNPHCAWFGSSCGHNC